MRPFAVIALTFVLLAGCGKSPDTTAAAPSGNEQTATVKLKDGGSFTGTVKSADSNAITLLGPGGESRTYPMGQVAAVNYASGAPGLAAPAAAVIDKPSPTGPPPSPVPAPAPPATST